MLVIAATNRPDLLDAALLRPGRFDRLVHVPPPDVATRAAILHVQIRGMSVAGEVDMQRIAARTQGDRSRQLGTTICVVYTYTFAVLRAAHGGRPNNVQTTAGSSDTAHSCRSLRTVHWAASESNRVRKPPTVGRTQTRSDYQATGK